MNLKTVIFKTSLIARLCNQTNPYCREIFLEPTNLRVKNNTLNNSISYDEIESFNLLKRNLWFCVHLTLNNGEKIEVKGLWRKKAAELYEVLNKKRSSFLDALNSMDEKSEFINSFNKWLVERENGNYWVSQSELSAVLRKKVEIVNILNLPIEYTEKKHNINQMLSTIDRFLKDPNLFRTRSNEAFIPLELERYKNYFDTVESNPLTYNQRRAIISHEDNTSVIAGAGSGKTSVIVAKAGYLITKGLCTKNEILLIAYNRSAAEEMEERINERINITIKVATFHALGLNIIASVEKVKPSLSKTATDTRAMGELVNEILFSLIKDKNTYRLITLYFQSFFAPYKSEFDFKELGDYYKYIKDNELLTLKGELVKSFEEVEISNFLYLNGIEFVYEKQYSINTASINYRQYEPDFYLPQHDIYIEHFGILRDGSTAPYVDREKYHEGITWKRELHKAHETTLIETYSHEKREGILTSNLEEKLLEHGVHFNPLSNEEVLFLLKSKKRIDPLSKLVLTFLNHFKGGGYSINEIQQQARKRGIFNGRFVAFLAIFEKVLELYENKLRENNVIDFNDMINKAITYTYRGNYLSPYKCILVDEFQDISNNRARLIKRLREQKNSHRLFCVGDDWQAIYRFAGSDISLMREFAVNFGFTETVFLDKTFRFNDKIEAVATKFILKNPNQIKKSITTLLKENSPRVIMFRPNKKTDDTFIEVLTEINKINGNKKSKVLCLGRYNYIQDGLSWSKAISSFKNFELEFKTVHSAKGLEADYVVVLGMKSGKYGFPSEITDDPILDAVLSKPESHAHAEERRLFYVALTRAKKAVYLIADYSSPSCFVSELNQYDDLVESFGTLNTTPANCPLCKTGELAHQTGDYGAFYSCQNYPLCKYTVNACTQCGMGLMVYNSLKKYYCCNNKKKCTHIEQPCPNCDSGRLMEKKGKNGAFYGCSNYKSHSCRYTES